MKIKIVALLATLGVVTAAYSQSSEDRYVGQYKLLKDVPHKSDADQCMTTGTPIEFRVSAPKITLMHDRSGQTPSGSLASDGAFRISFSHPAGKTGKFVTADYRGTLKGSQIDGNGSGLGPGRDCFYSFAARKQGRN
jgi:hypothetical protein